MNMFSESKMPACHGFLTYPSSGRRRLSTPSTLAEYLKLTDDAERDRNLQLRLRKKLAESLRNTIHGQKAKYCLLEKVGQGGMGMVYRAKNIITSEIVAVKTILPNLLPNPEVRDRFFLEIGALQNQGEEAQVLPALIDFGLDRDGQPFIVMEFLEGREFSTLIVDSPWDLSQDRQDRLREICLFVSQACFQVEKLHKQGRVHRDIKPSNLLVMPDNSVRLLDAGLIKEFYSRTSESQNKPERQITRGATPHTPGYASPEQVLGMTSGNLPTTDIYSMGATLMKLLTNVTPNPENSKASIKLAFAKLPPFAQQLQPILERMLKFDPSERFSRICEAGQEIKRFANSIQADGSSSQRSKSRYSTTFAVMAGFFALAIALGIVVVVKNAKGTIRIEIVDADLAADLEIEVANGHEHIILNKSNEWSARITPGDVQLTKKTGVDQFELDKNSFTVRRFNTTIVKVTTALNPAIDGPPAEQQFPLAATNVDADCERSVAERILALKGMVRVTPPGTPSSEWDGSGASQAPFIYAATTEFNRLPEDDFVIVAINLATADKEIEQLYPEILRLSNIAHIYFGTALSDVQVSKFSSLPKTTTLVEFHGSQLTEKGLSVVSQWRDLTSLGFKNLENFGDTQLKKFSQFENLSTILLARVPITDPGLLSIADFPNLNTVVLADLSITDAGVLSVAKVIYDSHKNIKFYIRNCPGITSQGMANLKLLCPGSRFDE